MSLHAKLLNLLSGIDDPSIRIEISKTIFYLYNVYASGGASEDDIRNDLVEIATMIVEEKNPTLSPDDKKKLVETIVNDLLRAFKMESMMKRSMMKYKLR